YYFSSRTQLGQQEKTFNWLRESYSIFEELPCFPIRSKVRVPTCTTFFGGGRNGRAAIRRPFVRRLLARDSSLRSGPSAFRLSIGRGRGRCQDASAFLRPTRRGPSLLFADRARKVRSHSEDVFR